MINVDLLLQCIKEAFQKIENIEKNDIILFLGATGAGKSTLINYLLGYKLARGKGGMAVPANANLALPAEIGKSVDSQTRFPSIYKHMNPNVSFCDCPGFYDNRGPEARVSISLATERIVKLSSQIGSMVVVIDWPSFEAERGKGLNDIALILGTLVKPAFDVTSSILFVFTKADLRSVDYDYIDNKINDLFEYTFQQIEKFKMHKINHSVKLDLNSPADDILNPLEELDRLQKILWVLKLMQNRQNVILADVLDDGKSREEILSKLALMKSIPKEAFDFYSYDVTRKSFTESAINMINSFIDMHSKIPLVSKALYFEEITYQELEMSVKKYAQEIQDIDTHKTLDILKSSSGLISELYTEIESRKSTIAKMDEEMQSLSSQKLSFEHEIIQLDSADDTFYIEADRCKKKFTYDDIPYTRAEINNTGGNVFKTKQNSPSTGIFQGKYKGSKFSAKYNVEVNIYVEKRNLPRNKLRIQFLKGEVPKIDNRLLVLKDSIATFIQQNIDADRRITCHINEYQEKLDIRSNELKEKIEAIKLILSNIKTNMLIKQKELEKLKDEYSENSPLLKTLLLLSELIDFNHPTQTAPSCRIEELSRIFKEQDSLKFPINDLAAVNFKTISKTPHLLFYENYPNQQVSLPNESKIRHTYNQLQVNANKLTN